MAPVLLASSFTPTDIKFSGLEKNKKGGKVVFLSIPDATGAKQRITLQTPVVSVPFGVTPYQEANTGEIQSYSVDMSFRGTDTDPRIAEFLAKMRQMDDILLDAAVVNSKEWFGKQMSKEIVSEFYRHIVKEPTNPQYAPVMKAKVQLNNGEPTAAFFDEQRQPRSIDYISKGSTVKMILELDRLWFVNKNFGATWRLLQCAVCSKPRRLEGYSFQDDGDDDEDLPMAGGEAAEEF
jgi:hypothetical protein